MERNRKFGGNKCRKRGRVVEEKETKRRREKRLMERGKRGVRSRKDGNMDYGGRFGGKGNKEKNTHPSVFPQSFR